MGAAACAALCMAVAPVEAHEGEVHETPSAAARPRTAAGSGSAKAVQRDAAGAGRIETHSEAFELLVQADGGRLTLYLDRYADNAPVSDARLTVEAGGRALQALPQPDGSYRVELPPGARRADLPLTVTVETARDADLLVLDLPAERPAARAATAGAGVEGALDEAQGVRTQARGDGAGPGHAAADGADRGSGPPANRGDSPPASAWQRAALVAAALVALTALIPALIPLLRRARRKRAGEADAGRDAGRDAGGDGLRDDDHDDDHDDDRRPHRDDDREGHGDRHGRPRRPPDHPPYRLPHREDRPDASDGKGPPA